MSIIKKGFTLVELALALVIIGIVITLASTMYQSLFSTADYVDLSSRVQSAVQGIYDFAINEGRLPTVDEFEDTYGHLEVEYATERTAGSLSGFDGRQYHNSAIYNRANTICTAIQSAFIEDTSADIQNSSNFDTIFTLRAENKIDSGIFYEQEYTLLEVLGEIGCSRLLPELKVISVDFPPLKLNSHYTASAVVSEGRYPYYFCGKLVESEIVNDINSDAGNAYAADAFDIAVKSLTHDINTSSNISSSGFFHEECDIDAIRTYVQNGNTNDFNGWQRVELTNNKDTAEGTVRFAATTDYFTQDEIDDAIPFSQKVDIYLVNSVGQVSQRSVVIPVQP